jgi:hypothetical protein
MLVYYTLSIHKYNKGYHICMNIKLFEHCVWPDSEGNVICRHLLTLIYFGWIMIKVI